jgi:hypothetical protein
MLLLMTGAQTPWMMLLSCSASLIEIINLPILECPEIFNSDGRESSDRTAVSGVPFQAVLPE